MARASARCRDMTSLRFMGTVAVFQLPPFRRRCYNRLEGLWKPRNAWRLRKLWNERLARELMGADFIALVAVIASAIVAVSAAYIVKHNANSRFSGMPRNVRITEGYVYYGNQIPRRFEWIRPSIADVIARILVRQEQGQFSRDSALDLISDYVAAVRREDLDEARRIESEFSSV